MNHSYNMNGLQAHNMSQPHLNGLSQRREGQHDGQSLPPLSGAVAPYPSYSVGMSQHPATSTASYPPSSQSHYGSNLPQLAPQQSHSMPMGAYSQPGAYGNMTQSMMPASSTSMAPNMPSTTSTRLPDLHPRPQDGSSILAQLQQHNMPNPMLAPGANPNEPEPTHVVGQQGRRGILPSAPGRAPGAVRSTVPVKDADGKYPCPHCNKTYQHAKHLKRHLLRHTGDRPYMCKLCKDTFSRSDILKRHFQKCSVRRGVVGDMDHLEGSRAHLQKNRQSVDTSQNIQFLNPSSVNPSPVYDNSNGIPQLPPGMMQQQPYPDMQSSSARNSRSNSLVRPPSGFMDGRRSIGTMEQTRPGDFQNYSAFSTPGGLPSMIANGNHPGSSSATHSPVGNMPNGMSNGHGYSGFGAPDSFQQQVPEADVEGAQIGRQDWNTASQSHHQSSASDYNQGQETAGPSEPGPSSVADTSNVHESAFDGLYTNISESLRQQSPIHWHMSTQLERKASSIVNFCLAYIYTTPEGPDPQDEPSLRALLTVSNVEEFLDEFRNFQGHWPLLHMPTFDPASASDSLVLTMICIGAVYSDRINISQTRWLMQKAKHAVHSASHIFNADREASPNHDPTGFDSTEEIQALIMMQVLFLWHGSSKQRAQTRNDWPRFAILARKCRLLQPMRGRPNKPGSCLHQLDSSPCQLDTSWNWQAWVEQEKRSRAFYILYLVDCAMAIYFNAAPTVEATEINLRLPADDATWEAATSDECAKLLGLYELDNHERRILGNSGSSSQPEFQVTLKSLFDPTSVPKTGETNASSKFILVHAIHATLWNVQRREPTAGTSATSGLRRGSSEASTPEVRSGSRPPSIPNSGNNTPDIPAASTLPYSRFGLKGVKCALDNWKRLWDLDNNLPLSRSPSSPVLQLGRPPRVGFCRDGIYYYYLAVQFYNRSHRTASSTPNFQELWKLSPDTRFALVMDLIKRIKHWMSSDQGKSGRELDLGSMGNIDDKYGVADLTLDMSMLFTRIVPRTPSSSGERSHLQ